MFITNHQENENQNYKDISPQSPHQLKWPLPKDKRLAFFGPFLGKKKKKRQKVSVGKDVEKRKFLYAVGRNVN